MAIENYEKAGQLDKYMQNYKLLVSKLQALTVVEERVIREKEKAEKKSVQRQKEMEIIGKVLFSFVVILLIYLIKTILENKVSAKFFIS